MTNSTFAESLGEYIQRISPQNIAMDTREIAQDCILDALGAALAAVSEDRLAKIAQTLTADAGVHGAFVVGSERTFVAADAAWANGVLMHIEDFDDTPHTSYFLPALMAVTAEKKVSGAEFIGAWVAAYNTWMILAGCLDFNRPFNPTSVFAPIAAAAGVAKLRGLDAGQTANALVIATQYSGGLRGHFGTDVKAFDAGRSAQAGLKSVDLASAGWAGELAIFESENGWGESFGLSPGAFTLAVETMGKPSALVSLLGRRPGIKQWPCCARNIGPVAALEQIVESASGVVRALDVEVGFVPEETAVFRTNPRTPQEARFDLGYALVAMARDKEITQESFTNGAFEKTISDPLLRNISVKYVASRAGNMQTETCLVTAHMSSGEQLTSEVEGLRFLDHESVQEKFLHNSTNKIPKEAAASAMSMTAHLNEIEDAEDVFRLFRKDNS